jgi:2-amino-4-hydroxy-6-hydroxymethyldihydropteridine diphosphokinase
MKTHAVLIALGANLPSRAGQPEDTIRAALAELGERHVSIRCTSSFYRTPAWPDPHDPAYVNAVARAETTMSPRELLRVLHETETAFGRSRSVRNAPRTLDLDLIDFDAIVDAGPPELPHPRAAARAFVLVPLAEVAPGWRHPATGEPVTTLIDALPPEEVAAVRPIG